MGWIFQMRYKKLKSLKGLKSYEMPKLASPMMDTENYNSHDLPFQYCSFSMFLPDYLVLERCSAGYTALKKYEVTCYFKILETVIEAFIMSTLRGNFWN